jgi:DNA processing protein
MTLRADQLLHENAALVALLDTIDRKRDSWTSIANAVERNGSAIAVLNHEIDPINNRLYDDEDPADYENSEPTLFDDEQIPASPQRKATLEKALADAQRQVESWQGQGQGMDFISVLDERYPNRLRQVVDMPPFLFADGMLVQDDMGVSVVGSREATPDSVAFAQETASMLVGHDLTVIAGLAAGIDAAAHRRALDEGGRTVAFIGTGITRQYPVQNRMLQREISERGLVLSQFWPDQGPTRYTFPMRNASMSGYGLATVVVQAGEHSGTRIQARQAQQHGRPVILRDTVAQGTQWGRKLVGKPGVYVASSVLEVQQILQDILRMPDVIEDAMSQLIDMTLVR